MAEDHDHRHPEFVVGIDLGAGVTRAHHLYADGEFVPMCSLEYRPIRPRSGWSELDPDDVLAALAQALDYAPGAAGVAIASEAGTAVAWDAETGAPVHNALAPDDQRAGPLVADLVSQGAAALTTARAGLLPDARLPAAKFRWLLDHAPEAAALARSGRLRLGTMGSFCLDRLAGVHAMDVSAASRTGLMDLTTGRWDAELCRLFGVPPELLPEIRPTVADHGVLEPGQTPLVATVFDRHARLFGHGCHAPGRIAVSFDGEGEALAVAGHMPPAGPPRGCRPRSPGGSVRRRPMPWSPASAVPPRRSIGREVSGCTRPRATSRASTDPARWSEASCSSRRCPGSPAHTRTSPPRRSGWAWRRTPHGRT